MKVLVLTFVTSAVMQLALPFLVGMPPTLEGFFVGWAIMFATVKCLDNV